MAENLDVKKKADGKVDGSLYFCKKQKQYINPSNTGCEKFEKHLKDKTGKVMKFMKLEKNIIMIQHL